MKKEKIEPNKGEKLTLYKRILSNLSLKSDMTFARKCSKEKQCTLYICLILMHDFAYN